MWLNQPPFDIATSERTRRDRSMISWGNFSTTYRSDSRVYKLILWMRICDMQCDGSQIPNVENSL